ncbi:hypothetical protein EUA98_19380, partial [Pengzhenrongella frigida]
MPLPGPIDGVVEHDDPSGGAAEVEHRAQLLLGDGTVRSGTDDDDLPEPARGGDDPERLQDPGGLAARDGVDLEHREARGEGGGDRRHDRVADDGRRRGRGGGRRDDVGRRDRRGSRGRGQRRRDLARDRGHHRHR